MNKSLILVCEDDPSIQNLITTTLQTHDYRYLSASDGASAIMEASSHNPDILLLDLGLPDMDGVDVIKRIRTWSNMPIIIISARSEDTDKIDALDAGADDYLTKPFSFREMVSRVKAQLRRREWEKDDPTVRRHGVIAIYPNEHRVTVSGKNLSLSPKEYDILSKLMERPSWVLTREQLLESIWGADYEGEMRTVDMHMTNLRRKLEEAGAKDYIQTVRAVGYKMCDLK